MNSLGGLLNIAGKFGFLSPGKRLLVDGLQAAPKPVKKELTDDWIQNIDVIGGALGCVLVGLFEGVIAPYNSDELHDLSVEPLLVDLPIPDMYKEMLMSSFDKLIEMRAEVGNLTDAINSGQLLPEQITGGVVVGIAADYARTKAPVAKKGLLVRKSLVENANGEKAII